MLGEQIKRVRTSRHKSQVEFASVLNVSKQSVSNWENNNIVPSVDVVRLIAQKFDVSADYLLELDEKFIINVNDLPFEVVAHLQQIINDLKRRHRND